MRLSVSQLKKFHWSPAQRAGEYILWIKDDQTKDHFVVGNAIHKYLETLDDNIAMKIIRDSDLSLKAKTTAYEQYAIGKENFFNIPDSVFNETFNTTKKRFLKKWENELKVPWEYEGVSFVWYIDKKIRNCVIDYKCITKFTNMNTNSIFTWLTKYQEYAIQMYFYMLATKSKKWYILEILKVKQKTKAPDQHYRLIPFVYNDALIAEVEPIIKWCIKWIKQIKEMYKNVKPSFIKEEQLWK